MGNVLKMKLYALKMRAKKHAIKYLMDDGFYFRQKGYCPCCEKDVYFESKSSWLRLFFL